MFNIRPIPATMDADPRKVFSNTNVELTGRFKPSEGWVFFELPGNNKFAMPIKALHDHEYEDFEEACKTVKMPFISRVLYSRLKSYAELTLMMRGH